MERLTERTATGVSIRLNNPQNEKEAREQLMEMFQQACCRLAAYEDTGLTTEEIAEAQISMRAALGLACEAQAARDELASLRSQLTETQRERDAAVECTEEVEYSLANSRFSAAWAAIRKWRGKEPDNA